MNNHPFKGREQLYLVHNGILADHEGYCRRRGLSLRTACDSEAILRMMESAETPALGLDETVNTMRGSMAVAVYDGKEDVTYLARNDGRPFWLLRLQNDRRWFYASTREILLDALERVMGSAASDRIEILIPLAAGQVHVLSSDLSLIGLPELTVRFR